MNKMRQELVNQTANNRARASHYAAGFPCIRLHAQCAYDVDITGYGGLSASEGDERNASPLVGFFSLHAAGNKLILSPGNLT